MTMTLTQSLSHLPLGGKARITEVTEQGSPRKRLFDLGLIRGTEIEAVHRSPGGDPRAYFIRGALIALRNEDADKIIVSSII